MAQPFEPFLEEIQTSRLIISCLRPAHLRLIQDSPLAFERAAGFTITHDAITPTVQRAIQMKLKKMKSAPEADSPWFTYWLIQVRETRFGAGLIGFKGIPAYPADVEIGYGIDPACQNHGFMTEAVIGLSSWAFKDPRCTGIFANVLKTNPASSKVLEKAGFTRLSTNVDAIFWRLSRSA